MKLRHLRVEQVRQFRSPITLSNLQAGINLIHGPNESGKSTLVRAIRAAFFERYRSKSVEDLRPWGDSAAAPTIEVAFDHNQQDWKLIKSFLQRKRCDLTVDGHACSGDEAEEKLAELLGFQFPKKGASKEEHWGIPGLLWVEQGTGQEVEKAVEHAGDHLKSALNSLVGESADSSGDTIIQTVEKQRGELLTSTGKPRGEYLQLERDRDTLQEEIASLQARIQHYQEQVDRLGALDGEYRKAQQERPWEQARRHMEQAKEQFRRVEILQQEQTREQESLEHIRQRHGLLQENRHQLLAQEEKLSQREAMLKKAEGLLEQAVSRAGAAEKRMEQARKEYEAAAKQADLARLKESRERLAQDITRLESQRASIRKNLKLASGYQKQLEEARQRKLHNKIDEEAVSQLKKVRLELDEETIRSQAIATRLSWQLEQGKTLQLNGEAITGQSDTLLLEGATLDIPGVGTLGITPGGEDLARARRTLKRLQQSFAERLQSLEVESLQAAEQRLDHYQKACTESRQYEQLLSSVAPAGIEQLNSQDEELRAELDERKAELEATQPLSAAKGRREIPSVESAEKTRNLAEQALQAAESEDRDQRTAVLTATQARDNAHQEWQQLREELESGDRQQRVKDLNRAIAAAEQRQEQLVASLSARESQIQQARPELLKQDIERYERSADTQEKAQATRERELRDIRVRLEALGAEGLEEQLNEKLAELEHSNRRFTELDRRARALDLLLELLTGKRQALTRRLQAPLQKHLDHYLTILFPEASLEVDEHLVPGKFSRGDERGSMAELSFGAREQMGLISRLAYADLLQEAGRPTLILLDDTLVHSDALRLEGMKRILFDASRRHQILLFTCHPEKWDDLGVEPLDIQSLKTSEV